MDEKYHTFYLAQNNSKSKLVILDGEVVVLFKRSQPCWWHRLWYKILLGWEWESIEEQAV